MATNLRGSGWSSFNVVQHTPTQLVLRTNPKLRALAGCFLPVMVLLGCLAIAVGVGGLAVVATAQDYTLGQSLLGIVFSSIFLWLGLLLLISPVYALFTVRTCVFDRPLNQVRLERKTLWLSRVRQHPLDHISEVQLAVRDDSDSRSYRIELVLISSKQVPIGDWNSVSPQAETEIVNQIREFLQLRQM